jgi:glycosyltransferase involved in cell wall biosynthesis
MKICLINNLYPPHARGGAEVVVETIVTGLLRQGHTVVLITIGRKRATMQTKNLTIHHVKPWNVFSFLDINQRPTWLRLIWHPLDVFSLSGAYQVRAILKKQQPDLVMTHNLKGISYLVPSVIRKLGLRHFHTLHDVALSRPSGLIFFGQEKPFLILDKIYEKINRKLFGHPDLVISPSRWLMSFYRKLGFFDHAKVMVLPNPVVFRHVGKKKIVRKAAPVQFLFAGQIEPSKGIFFLLDTCQNLRGEWQLNIAGTGTRDERVKELAELNPNIKLLGHVPHNQMPATFVGADLTVVPSLCYENSPSVIYESLAANTPVIAADIGGVAELVKDDVNGFTFAAGNKKNLVEVLQHFIDHPESIARLKKNCFLSVREYSVDHYVKQLLTAPGT